MNSLQERLDELLPVVRAAGSDLREVEVKDASGGFPESLLPTISAFTNGSGGLVVLGLTEPGFVPTNVAAAQLAGELASRCSTDFTPPVRPDIDICNVDGAAVVVAEVHEGGVESKPCFVSARAKHQSPLAYIRSHDGNRRLTPYEHHALQAAKGQPSDDIHPAPGTGIGDLDPELVQALLRRIRSTRDGHVWPDDDATCLSMLGVLVDAPESGDDPEHMGSSARPQALSLAGLLALGRFPQRHFPRLEIAFAAYPTDTGTPLADGTRFLDSQPIDGAIPFMLEEAAAALRRNMRQRGIVVGLWREDYWDYPLEAVREVVVNALMHRDYHAAARGQPVTMSLYPDRLEITSPGGLYGAIDPDRLLTAPVTAARNSHLAKLLRDLPASEGKRTVCENYGTGLMAVAENLRRAGLAPPELVHTLTEFRVIFRSHTVLDADATDWLARLEAARFGKPPLTDRQRLGLAFIRRSGSIDNRAYRALTGSSATEATNDLAALRDERLVERRGGRRWAAWHLSGELSAGTAHATGDRGAAGGDGGDERAAQDGRQHQNTTGVYGARTSLTAREQFVLDLLAPGALSSRELADLIEVSPQAVRKWLRRLEEYGLVKPTEAGRRSRFQRWERIADAS